MCRSRSLPSVRSQTQRSLPNRSFPGTVARIDIESDRVTEERRIYVACDWHPPDLHLGEQAEVYVAVADLPQALLVPQAAVEGFTGGGGTVWTVEDGRLNRRAVRFGHRTLDGRLEIVGDLPDDAQVVIRLRPELRVGRRASPVAATSS